MKKLEINNAKEQSVAEKYILVSGDESLTALHTLRVPPMFASYVERAFWKM